MNQRAEFNCFFFFFFGKHLGSKERKRKEKGAGFTGQKEREKPERKPRKENLIVTKKEISYRY